MIIAIEIPLYFKELLSVGFYNSEISQMQDIPYFLYKKIFLVEKSLSNVIFSYISKVLNRYMMEGKIHLIWTSRIQDPGPRT